MSDTLSYTMRIPIGLKSFLDAEARKRGKSTASIVVEACWAYLEEDRSASATSSHSRLEVALSIPGVSLGMKDPAVPMADTTPVTIQREPCAYTETIRETGFIYGCSLHLGHKGPHKRGEKVGEAWG